MAKLVVVLALLAGPALASRAGTILRVAPIDTRGAATSQKGSCDACLFSFRMLDDVLADTTVVEEVVNFAQTRVCPAVGGGDKCTNLAEGLLPVVIDWIRLPATAWQFCSAAGSCDSSTHAALKLQLSAQTQAKPQVADPTQCAMCQLVVTQVQLVLNNSAVLDKLNSTAQEMCTHLPPDMATMCLNFVNTYEPLVVALVAHSSPQQLCEMLGVCAHQQVARLSAAQLPRAQVDLSLYVKNAMSAAQATKPGPLKDSCDMCKMAVIEAHSVIANPQIQAQLTNYTEALCESFGPSFADTCKLYVDTYAPVVYSIMAQYLVPDTLCVAIGVCKPPPATLFDMAEQYLDAFMAHVRSGMTSHAQANGLVTHHVSGSVAKRLAREETV